jgi:hypothetical protein
LRPVAELMFSDFLGVCFDQIFNQTAKFRYMFGGKARTPLVIRTMVGAGRSAAAQHSQSPYHIFTSVPGLKVVVPSNAYDAKGLLIQAIRDDDPVVFCEHKLMYDLKAEVPDEAYTIPFEGPIVRDGDDVTTRRPDGIMPARQKLLLRGSNANDRSAHHLAADEDTIPKVSNGRTGRGRSHPRAWRPTRRLVAGAFGARRSGGSPRRHARTVRTRLEKLYIPDQNEATPASARRMGAPDERRDHRDHHAQMGSDDDRGHGGCMAEVTGVIVRGR